MDKYKQPCPFEFKDMTCEEARASLEQTYKEKPWLVPDAREDESSSPMPGLSPKQEQEDFRTLLVQRMEDCLKRIEENQVDLLARMEKLVDALAEDQDHDEKPATYMDGSPV